MNIQLFSEQIFKMCEEICDIPKREFDELDGIEKKFRRTVLVASVDYFEKSGDIQKLEVIKKFIHQLF